MYIYTHAHKRSNVEICCNTLQYTRNHCNTLQHTAIHCNTLKTHRKHTAHIATHIAKQYTLNTLWHNTSHSVTWWWVKSKRVLWTSLRGFTRGPHQSGAKRCQTEWNRCEEDKSSPELQQKANFFSFSQVEVEIPTPSQRTYKIAPDRSPSISNVCSTFFGFVSSLRSFPFFSPLFFVLNTNLNYLGPWRLSRTVAHLWCHGGPASA